MSETFIQSLATGDVIQFVSCESMELEDETCQLDEIDQSENLDVPENPPKLIRSPSTYGISDTQFYPIKNLPYIVKSTTWDMTHSIYLYEIERKDEKQETIMYIFYEKEPNKFFCCIDQTHFKPYSISIEKV